MKSNSHPFEIKLEYIKNKVDTIIEKLDIEYQKNPEHIILDNSDIQKMFRATSKTISSWRKEGILPYFQIKSKIYYKLSDILEVVEGLKVNKKKG